MANKLLMRTSSLWNGKDCWVQNGLSVLVEEGNIKKVMPTELLSEEETWEILDLTGYTVLPGLIDCHSHHSMDASQKGFLEKMNDGIPELTLRAAAMMRKDLQTGVTFCRTLGDKEYLDVACRNAVNAGLLEGPESVVAGKGIRSANGHGFVGYPFRGADQIKNAIIENLRRGADFTKIYITGTLRRGAELPSYLSAEEIKSAVDFSHCQGVKIGSHCVGGVGLDWALEYGLDTLEHIYHISESQIEKLLKSKTEVVLTLSPILNDLVVTNYPEALIQGHFDERQAISDCIRKFISSGKPFGLGTDGMHGELVKEAAYAVSLGADNLTVLRGLTSYGAEICEVSHRVGVIKEGMQADLIAVEGNPLECIESLCKLKAVIKKGRLVH